MLFTGDKSSLSHQMWAHPGDLGLPRDIPHHQPWQSATCTCNEPNALSHLGSSHSSHQARYHRAFQKRCHTDGFWWNHGGGWWATGPEELETSLCAHAEKKNLFSVVLYKKSTTAIIWRRKKALVSCWASAGIHNPGNRTDLSSEGKPKCNGFVKHWQHCLEMMCYRKAVAPEPPYSSSCYYLCTRNKDDKTYSVKYRVK